MRIDVAVAVGAALTKTHGPKPSSPTHYREHVDERETGRRLNAVINHKFNNNRDQIL